MNSERESEGLIKAKKVVLRSLNTRLYSKKEIWDKLEEKGHSQTVINQTLAFFEKQNMINDRRFAQEWISSRLRRPFGKKRIIIELQNKGIEKKILNEELSKAFTNYDELEVVTQCMEKRLSQYTNIETGKAKQRVFNYLIRRGFSKHSINKVMAKL